MANNARRPWCAYPRSNGPSLSAAHCHGDVAGLSVQPHRHSSSMRVRIFQSLAVRLAGWILILSGATFLVLTEINRRAVERILVDEAEVQAMMATVAVADGLDAVIGAAERVSRTIARELEGRTLSPADAERMARNILLDHPGIHGFSIAVEPRTPAAAAERLGVYVYRSNTVSHFTTRDLAAADQAYWNRDWYREVIDKAQP